MNTDFITMPITDYTIIEEVSANRLSKEVKEWITKGWIPQGGVSMMYKGSVTIYAQALIKTENK